jgi:hypothetical protein
VAEPAVDLDVYGVLLDHHVEELCAVSASTELPLADR